mgnify:CR=1 FL=1
MPRPTIEELTKARADFDENELAAIDASCGPSVVASIRTLLAATEPPTAKELAELLAKHWHGEFCETFDVEYAQSRMNHGDRFDVAENVKFVMAHFLGPVKP